MKTRNGFVSNSSSSSFVIAVKRNDRCVHCGRKDPDFIDEVEKRSLGLVSDTAVADIGIEGILYGKRVVDCWNDDRLKDLEEKMNKMETELTAVKKENQELKKLSEEQGKLISQTEKERSEEKRDLHFRDIDMWAENLRKEGMAPAIVDEAEERVVDLILMGVKYKRRFGEFSLGDVVPYVLKNALCRVILYHQYTT